jgi:hypothetical protein
MDDNKQFLAKRRTVLGGVIAAGAAALAVTIALLVTGGGGTDPAPGHGPVVARLPIPFLAARRAGTTDVIHVRVRVGQRFSIRAGAVDYYAFWTETTGPDPQIVRAAGQFADGRCQAQVAGCAIPYLYTFVARSRGTTAMTWRYRQGYTNSQPSVSLVAVDITVI